MTLQTAFAVEGEKGHARCVRDEDKADMEENKQALSIMLPCDHFGNPASYVVGRNGVTKIEQAVMHLGDHGIVLMHVYEGDRLALSAPLKAVAFVEWK